MVVAREDEVREVVGLPSETAVAGLVALGFPSISHTASSGRRSPNSPRSTPSTVLHSADQGNWLTRDPRDPEGLEPEDRAGDAQRSGRPRSI